MYLFVCGKAETQAQGITSFEQDHARGRKLVVHLKATPGASERGVTRNDKCCTYLELDL